MPDDYPKINVLSNTDSTSLRSEIFFNGIATDDYGVSEIVMVYYDAKSS